ncbi:MULTISPECIES: right-handed parallel beta-helix repeat-containing protein [unclassified Streptomyces]|uniref:right-handed parallel beta-helix repeat-containing protein n=1 Tax=unclassified Streptomyces TaxID=2593676 RepID=UPI00236609DE|nr:MULTISPECIES: right-handed parallel beta-helix repeat-containing protein [unclassified Streptomyces]MDF3146053.1 right-handed parallel beta-helix repeat-containing protein [Streptomyces sp. T21Q-yed]WDF43246.1 right-handed parallel beta-helix repeat-containing protein [Streptomyces sp. T12]
MGSTASGMRGTAIWTAAAVGAALLTVLGPASEASGAATLVVASDGNDAAPGTLAQPLRTIQRAVDLAKPGDVITVRGGTYALTDNITISTSGTASQPISLGPYQGERVVVDGEQLPASHTPVGGSIPRAERGAIHMEASHWRISGLELVNGPYGIYCDGCNNNVFSRLSTHDNYESGFQLQGSSSNNQILNLDSYGNRDPRKNGESADGLAIKEGSGTGNVVRGARLWNNVDDGFDAWKFASPIQIENTIAYGNGYNRWNFPDFSGDGNGFKMGGGSPAPAVAHILRNTISYRNAAHGVTDNGNPGAMTLTRNTTWANAGTGFDADIPGGAATLTANLSVDDARAAAVGSGTVASGNSWNLGETWNASSVLSTDPAPITGPRSADGSLPSAPNFLVPRSGAAVGARF